MPVHSRSCSGSGSFTSFANGETPFSSIPWDVIEDHILTKIDGPTLASAACVSTQLRPLCDNENLWMNICNTTWPSITHPCVRDAISTFPSGYRSFFSNSYPTLKFHHPRPQTRTQTQTQTLVSDATRELISAVDIRYKNKVVYSKIQVTNTLTEGFLLWPICIHLVNVRDSPVKFRVEEEVLLSHIVEQVKVSWIMIDPTRKRAVNLSGIRPVLVEQLQFNSAYKRLRYSTLMVCSDRRTSVEFQIMITCGGMHKGELMVCEVNLQVVNVVDGVPLNGKEGLVILHKAMESDKRTRGEEGVEEYYLRSERKEKDVVLNFGDYACLFVLFVAMTGWIFCSCFRTFILRRKQM